MSWILSVIITYLAIACKRMSAHKNGEERVACFLPQGDMMSYTSFKEIFGNIHARRNSTGSRSISDAKSIIFNT
jgi:hypothetical protein